MAKAAIVTAAGKGMGAACARELASRGYRVSLLARSPDVEALARELGGGATRGSVDSAEDLERFVSETLDAYGRIDVVVNNTGNPPKGPLLELSGREIGDVGDAGGEDGEIFFRQLTSPGRWRQLAHGPGATRRCGRGGFGEQTIHRRSRRSARGLYRSGLIVTRASRKARPRRSR